jgi:hypothetical protein
VSSARTIGRYEVVREIGRGGMAVVHLARQVDLDRPVALKELGSFHASDPSFAERFAREARVGGVLTHPNIVTVYETFQNDGTPYIAMEYLERGSLRPLIGQLDLAEVAGVLEGLLAGLDHAFLHEIVHRDLKPENVLVSAEGRVKIADFGVAKAYNRAWTAQYRTATGTTMGTPTYMAPEQAMGRGVDTRTDLYAVGAMAYELLAGQPPFHGIEEPMAILLRHVSDPPPPLAEAAPGVDPQLAAWVHRLLAKDPAERPPRPQAAWEELEDVILGVLGPRWRREARLAEREGEQHELRPLTPARFDEPGEVSGALEATEPLPEPAAPPERAAATPAESVTRQKRRRGGALLVGAGLLAAGAIAAAAVAGAFGGGDGEDAGGGSTPSAGGTSECLTQTAKGAIPVPSGITVPVGPRAQQNDKTFTFLVETAPSVGAIQVSTHGGRAPFYRVEALQDTRCRPLEPALYGQGQLPNFSDYDHVRATYGDKIYDFSLSSDGDQLSASVTEPAKPELTVSATRSASRVRAQGTLPDDAYGDVKLTFTARQPDGGSFERTTTVQTSGGRFSGAVPLDASAGGIGDGTLTAAYEGDGNYLAASARTDVAAP